MGEVRIERVTPQHVSTIEDGLAELLAESVAQGAAVSFILPFGRAEALAFWRDKVFPDVAAGTRVLMAATSDGAVLGTVNMDIALPPNQPHRCDVAKMIVHPEARRQGIATGLMQALENEARALGKTLMTLDTRTGDKAERLYAKLGFVRAGVVPGFALDPDGKSLHATTYMYKKI